MSMLSAVLCLASCEKWLKATSSDKIAADDLFSYRDGFKDALTGVYLDMGDEDLYGGNATWFCNDLAAFPYILQTTATFKCWQGHTYSNSVAKPYISSMWLKAYNTIANINLILRYADSQQGVLPNYEKNLIKGELYGLRAYIQFDMLRMFGLPDWSGANASKMTVPYLTVYDKEPVAQKSYSETSKLLMNDVDSALALLGQDPVRGTVPDNFSSTINADGYWDNRTKHLNYFAVKALAARIYQWENDTDTAAELAQEVIDEAEAKKAVSWVNYGTLLSTTSDDSKDWTYSTEHIFSLEVPLLYTNSNGYLISSSATSGIESVSLDDVSGWMFPQIDPATGQSSGAEDIRGTACALKFNSYGYICYKLYGSSYYAKEYKNRMPMIKLAEMYYIVAENKIAKKDYTGALATLDIVRKNRAISESLPTTADASSELMKEYYREFINEGQLFYWLKHKQVTSSLSSGFNVKGSDLIYPYPDSEVNYGRNQEL